MDSVAEWATDYELCDDRVATIGGTVAWLDGLGVDVVVVAMPISDARATLFGGRDEVDAILAAAASEILDAGAAAFLDLSETIPSGLFRDITHVNEDGKEAFTTLLVGELTALGL
jgi:hypothetical protein